MEGSIMTRSWSPSGYLSALTINPEEADKLRGLGIDSPEQLLAQIRAAPEAFSRYLGADAARRIEQALRAMVPPSQSTDPVSPPGPLGVLLGPAPSKLPASKIDLERRDELFERIKRLKVEHAHSRELEAAERALEELLEGSQR
jgi:hypothetical protein